MLTTKTSTWEAVAMQDSSALRVKDVEDRAALTEAETLESVWRAEAEDTTPLSSAREDAEGFAQKITLLEDELKGESQAWEVSERERWA
jgi:CYTH domain-containing protein